VGRFCTLTLVNPTRYPISVYAGEGIGQILFFQSDEVCEVSYAAKGGKFNKAEGVQVSSLNRCKPLLEP
jgi:dCTP deaminase